MMNKKGMISMMVAAAAALSMSTVAFADETEAPAVKVYENQGMKLSIPEEYQDLVVVTAPEEGRELFSVCEKASIDAAKAAGYDDAASAGFVFGIDHLSEEEAIDMACTDMSGMEIFAQAEDGSYYAYTHATDVPVFRESNDEMDQGIKEWGVLNDWAWASVRENFIAENEGLTPVEFGHTMLDLYLTRIAYKNDVNYTISTTQYGPMEPKDVDPAAFVERLTKGVTYQYADADVEAPDGEYVVLSFPDDNIRYDFFSAEEGRNIIREVHDDDTEYLYVATFEDGESNAHDIMQEWYDALAQANGMTEAE